MLEKAFERCGRSSIGLKSDAYRLNLVDIILPRSSQFRELSLRLEPDVFHEFLCWPPGLFDALECVDLWYGYSIQIPSEKARVFQGSPMLQRVTIQALYEEQPLFPSFPLPLGLPWAQLTQLDFGIIRIPLTVVHKLMDLCSNIHECHLCLYSDSDFTDPFDAREYSTGTILLPCLRELDITVRGEDPTVDLYCRYLRPLRLPALQEFNFLLPEDEEELTSAFAAMIIDLSTSHPSLRSELCYLGSSFCAAEILAPLTFVTSITIPYCSLPRSAMELIFQGEIFPKLASLAVCIKPVDMEAFMAMLRMQWSLKSESQLPHTFTGIRSVNLCIDDSIAEFSHFTQEMDRLRDQFNLDIKLSRTEYDIISSCRCIGIA